MTATLRFALVSLSFLNFFIGLASGDRDRSCCPYSGANDTVCVSKDGCVLSYGSGSLASPELDECKILRDSKRYITKASALDCLAEETFDVAKSQDERRSPLLWKISPYVLNTESARGAPAVSVVVDYQLRWSSLRFRIVNTDVCVVGEALGPSCSPRCVTVERNPPHSSTPAEFVYDCEVGFYTSHEKMSARTYGSTYRFDICADSRCGSYLFTMPDVSRIREGRGSLPLVEASPILNGEAAVLWFPEPLRKSERFAIRTGDGVVKEATADAGSRLLEIDLSSGLDPGFHDIVMMRDDGGEPETIATFERLRDNGVGVAVIVCPILIILVLFAISASLYQRYIWVKNMAELEPKRSAAACKVLVITSLDDRQHVDVVLLFNSFLKSHCGVGEVYFALDPVTGMSSQAEEDPWKWAQETVAKVFKEEGHILVVGSPPKNRPGLGVYKNFEDDQAFVGTTVLREMAANGMVSVAMFPYSDSGTIPSLIPDHLKEAKLSLPKDMNRLLCAILSVEKRRLFPCLPIAFIQPTVSNGDLTETSEWKEILRRWDRMSEKLKEEVESDEAVPLRSFAAAGERIKMLEGETRLHIKNEEKSQEEEEPPQSPVHVQIESKMLSLGSSVLKNRDPMETTDC